MLVRMSINLIVIRVHVYAYIVSTASELLVHSKKMPSQSNHAIFEVAGGSDPIGGVGVVE